LKWSEKQTAITCDWWGKKQAVTNCDWTAQCKYNCGRRWERI